MKNPIVAVLAGAIVYFLVGMLEWTVIPWHDSVIKKIPEENLIRDSLKVVVPESGFYMFPSDKNEDGSRMGQQEYAERFRTGPAGIVIYQVPGKEVMSPKNFAIAIVTALCVSGFCYWILSLLSGSVVSFGCRMGVVLALGLFQWFASHIPYWNWFFFPTPYVLLIALDAILVYSALGAVLAWLMPKQS